MNISKNFTNKFFSKGTIAPLIIVIIAFALDRITKITVIKYQIINEGSLFVNDFLNFDLLWNTGISFGLFSQSANLYYHATTFLIFLVLIFLSYIIRKSNFQDRSLFSLILGGALGNFYDRLIYYAVPDFIDFHINNFHWFTFNVADIFITIGVIFLISKDLIKNKK